MSGQTTPSTGRAYGLLGFFVLLNIVNFVDRNLVAGFSPAIVNELNLTDTQYGLLVGIVFTIFYTFVGIGLGMLADRFNRPRLIAVGLFVWSLMTALTGMARNFAQMGAARLFVGAGEATLTPTALSLLSDVFPPERRSMASGVYYLGVPIGTGVGFVIAAVLGEYISWRTCFYIMGAIGVALSAVVLLIKDPPRGAGDAGDAVQTHETFSEVLRDLGGALRISPALRWVIIGCVITHIGLAAAYFDVRWLVAERGFTEQSAPALVGTVFILAGSLGTAFGGVTADALHRRMNGGRLYALVFLQLIALPFVVAYRFVDPELFIFNVSLFVSCIYLTAFYGPVFSAVQDLSPVRVRSTAVAFLLFSVNLIGIGGGGFLTGVLVDYLRENGSEQPLTYGIFTFGLIAMLSTLAYFLAARAYKRSHDLVLAASK